MGPKITPITQKPNLDPFPFAFFCAVCGRQNEKNRGLNLTVL
jgi:hypothetical protein